MAEQAINTIYLLGEQPDSLCGDLLKNLTARVFASGPASKTTSTEEAEMPSTPTPKAAPVELEPETPMPQSQSMDDGETAPARQSASPVKAHSRNGSTAPPPAQDMVGSFTLAQLVFVVGHVAIKHIVYLELVEREFKRRKDEKAKGKLRSTGCETYS